jgi:hypothetical protein
LRALWLYVVQLRSCNYEGIRDDEQEKKCAIKRKAESDVSTWLRRTEAKGTASEAGLEALANQGSVK